MKKTTVRLVRLEPSENMHLRNVHTGEVYESLLYLAKLLSVEDFEEITEEEYQKIIKERESVLENGDE